MATRSKKLKPHRLTVPESVKKESPEAPLWRYLSCEGGMSSMETFNMFIRILK